MGKKEQRHSGMQIVTGRNADPDGLASRSKKPRRELLPEGVSVFAFYSKIAVLKTDAHALKRFMG